MVRSFPEKLVFFEKKYRTTKLNELIELLCITDKGLGQKKEGRKLIFQFLPSEWYLQESNQGHTDFQSVALPTELRYQRIRAANLRELFIMQKKY